MASSDLHRDLANAHVFSDSKFDVEAVAHLHAAFEQSRHPMLIADDQRRWVTANAAACDLLGLTPEAVPWHTLDEFTPPGERKRLEEQWGEFLANGAAEGWYLLYVPGRGTIPVEFSATANVLPSRHLSVFIPPEETPGEQASDPLAHEMWTPIALESGGRLQLSDREREVMTLVASGHQSADIAERLFLSPETVKSHVHNALGKLGAHTRAHAVAIALVTGQIVWDA